MRLKWQPREYMIRILIEAKRNVISSHLPKCWWGEVLGANWSGQQQWCLNSKLVWFRCKNSRYPCWSIWTPFIPVQCYHIKETKKKERDLYSSIIKTETWESCSSAHMILLILSWSYLHAFTFFFLSVSVS